MNTNIHNNQDDEVRGTRYLGQVIMKLRKLERQQAVWGSRSADAK